MPEPTREAREACACIACEWSLEHGESPPGNVRPTWCRARALDAFARQRVAQALEARPATASATEAAEAFFHDFDICHHREPCTSGGCETKRLAGAFEAFAGDVQQERDALRDKVKRQAAELTNQGRVIADRSKQLDAMHWVWCSGGCPGGTHQKNPDLPPLTRELVETAVRNTERLVTRFANIEFRKMPVLDRNDFHAAMRERDALRERVAELEVTYISPHQLAEAEARAEAAEKALEGVIALEDQEHTPSDWLRAMIAAVEKAKESRRARGDG